MKKLFSPHLALLQKRGTRLAFVGILLTLVLAFGAFFHPSRAHATVYCSPIDQGPQNVLYAGGTLLPGQCAVVTIQTGPDTYSLTWLVMQYDGNLAVYAGLGTPLWVAPGTWCGSSCAGAGNFAVMQSDGNFCIYPNFPYGGKALWCSNTGGHPGAFLIVQGDGNVVIYDPTGTHSLWATGTNHS